jgi:hypothetical protein
MTKGGGLFVQTENIKPPPCGRRIVSGRKHIIAYHQIILLFFRKGVNHEHNFKKAGYDARKVRADKVAASDWLDYLHSHNPSQQHKQRNNGGYSPPSY